MLADPDMSVYFLFGNGIISYFCVIDQEHILQYSEDVFDSTAITYNVTQCLYVAQEISLGEQWNWISFNVHPDDTSLDNVFASLTAGNKIHQVKNQTQSATWYGVWVGNLTSITDGEGYLVYMNESAPDYSLTGMPIDVSNAISVNENWNWIGYYPQVPIDITSALASIQNNANQIKNQMQSATWYGVWVGNLIQMEPGVGYKLLMNADDELIYPESK